MAYIERSKSYLLVLVTVGSHPRPSDVMPRGHSDHLVLDPSSARFAEGN
jgi:hypothetical protein